MCKYLKYFLLLITINAYLWQLPMAFGHCQVAYHLMSDHRVTDQRSRNRLPQQTDWTKMTSFSALCAKQYLHTDRSYTAKHHDSARLVKT